MSSALYDKSPELPMKKQTHCPFVDGHRDSQ